MSSSELLLLEEKRKRRVKQLLQEAEKHQARLRLHGQTQLSKNDNENSAYKELLDWVETLLPADKYKRFTEVLRAPFSSLEITDYIFKELYRIFEGANPFFSYEFTDQQLSNDFEEYLDNVIKDKYFFKTEGWEQFKTCINSILIVDLPAEQTTAEPQPYYYFIQIDDVIDILFNDDDKIKSIEFKMSKHKVAVYDDEYYRVYEVKDDEKVSLLIEEPHELGYCPAMFFWDKDLKKENCIIKKSPITDALGKLDKYLVGDTFKEYADMYNSFPIIAAAEQICTFQDCDNGFIKKVISTQESINGPLIENFVYEKCPACGDKHDIGPGSFYEVTIPQNQGDPEIKTPVQFVTPDVTSLQYYNDKLKGYREDIEKLSLGSDQEMATNQAMNEEQVFGSFESRKNILIGIKESFEKIHKWANSTVARLRYGANRFIDARVFYGDEFFLKTLNQLMFEYEQAKKNGIPDDEVNTIYWQIIQTKYKGNPNKIQRSWILLNLNPMPHKDIVQSRLMVDQGAMSQVDFVIKARFDTFIMRFEREQTSILNFGSNLNFDSKIENMRKILVSYAQQEIQTQTPTQEEN